MSSGLRIWDGSGTLLLDSSDAIIRILGVVDVAKNTPGSVTGLSALTSGTPFYILVPQALSAPGAYIAPKVTISGSSIEWGYSEAYNRFDPSRIFYGVR